jgi:hypothetical protein
MHSILKGSSPTTRGVICCTISLTTRMPSGPWRNKNGPWASPRPTRPASVVSLTITSLTWLIVLVEVRTGCGRGMAKKYVSSRVIFILAFLRAKGRFHAHYSWRAAPWTICCILGQRIERVKSGAPFALSPCPHHAMVAPAPRSARESHEERSDLCPLRNPYPVSTKNSVCAL